MFSFQHHVLPSNCFLRGMKWVSVMVMLDLYLWNTGFESHPRYCLSWCYTGLYLEISMVLLYAACFSQFASSSHVFWLCLRYVITKHGQMGNTHTSCLGSLGFKSWPEDWPTWQKFSMVFLSSPRLGHSHFLSLCRSFTDYPTLKCCVVWATDSVIKCTIK
jgi:hypothetical protein